MFNSFFCVFNAAVTGKFFLFSQPVNQCRFYQFISCLWLESSVRTNK